jgi:hypothetical protein
VHIDYSSVTKGSHTQQLEAIGPFFGEAAPPGVPQFVLPLANLESNSNILNNLLKSIQDRLKSASAQGFNPNTIIRDLTSNAEIVQDNDDNTNLSSDKLEIELAQLLKTNEVNADVQYLSASISTGNKESESKSNSNSLEIGAKLVLSSTPQGCKESPAGFYSNQIVIVHRGDCTFMQKVTIAANANAVAVIVVNYELPTEDQSIFMMGNDPRVEIPQIPAVMVPFKDIEPIMHQLQSGEDLRATIHRFDLRADDRQYNSDLLAVNGHHKRLWIEGDLTKMIAHTLGDWSVEILENNRTYQFALYPTPSDKL